MTQTAIAEGRYAALGRALAQTQTLRAFTQPYVKAADLAREAGVSRQYVFSVLSDRTPPSEKLLEAARRLGIPV